MAEWVVTYTSMPIEADTAEEAISREGNGGGHWSAYPIRQRPEAREVHADIWPGDADLAVILGAVGGLRLAVYQHRDEQDRAGEGGGRDGRVAEGRHGYDAHEHDQRGQPSPCLLYTSPSPRD